MLTEEKKKVLSPCVAWRYFQLQINPDNAAMAGWSHVKVSSSAVDAVCVHIWHLCQ